MHDPQRIGSFALATLLAGGCAFQPDAPSIEAAPHVPGREIPGSSLYPAKVGPGDALEIQFYPNIRKQDGAYQVQIGDMLRVDVSQHPDLERTNLPVVYDGTISLPLIGQVRVAERTLDEVSVAVRERLRRAGVLTTSVVISVFEYRQSMRELLESMTEEKQGRGLIVHIQGDESIHLPFVPPIPSGQPLDEIRRQVRAAYDTAFNGQLEVTVNLRSRQERVVFVFGEVRLGGRFPWRREMTALNAIASAGGFLDSADTETVLLVRFDREGTYQYWVLDIETALEKPGTIAAQYPIQPNDVLFVAKTPIANANVFIDQYVRRMLPTEIGFGFGYAVNAQ